MNINTSKHLFISLLITLIIILFTSPGISSFSKLPLTKCITDTSSILNKSEMKTMQQAVNSKDTTILRRYVNRPTVKYGLTLLHVSSHFGNDKIIALALESGAKINAKDCSGFTPLHHAVAGKRRAKISTVKILLDAGADILAEGQDGQTAFSLAKRFALSDITAFLQERMEGKTSLYSDNIRDWEGDYPEGRCIEVYPHAHLEPSVPDPEGSYYSIKNTCSYDVVVLYCSVARNEPDPKLIDSADCRTGGGRLLPAPEQDGDSWIIPLPQEYHLLSNAAFLDWVRGKGSGQIKYLEDRISSCLDPGVRCKGNEVSGYKQELAPLKENLLNLARLESGEAAGTSTNANELLWDSTLNRARAVGIITTMLVAWCPFDEFESGNCVPNLGDFWEKLGRPWTPAAAKAALEQLE